MSGGSEPLLRRKKMNRMQSGGCRILVCHGPDCTEGGSEEILRLFESEIRRRQLEEDVKLFEYSCFGQCLSGPNVVIGPRIEDPDPLLGEGAFLPETRGEILYSRVTPADVPILFREHVIGGRPVKTILQRKKPS
jgi:(2Fe-2S) ferredoxin